MEQQEVDDVSERDAIPKVADCPTEDQAEPSTEQPVRRMSVQQIQNERCCRDCDRDEETALPSRGIREKTERGAGIEHEDEIEERQHRQALTRLKRRLYRNLGRLIDCE